MGNNTEEQITQNVLNSMAHAPDARLKEIMTSLIRHLHACIRAVDLTQEEWMMGIQFLTATGQMCNDTRRPVGKLLRALGRHPFRPAHIHLLISADGFAPVTTHLFVKGDPYLDSDAVFGTKDSLIVDFVRHDAAEEAALYNVSAPFYTVEYTFVLKPL
jgi:hypothetical protein